MNIIRITQLAASVAGSWFAGRFCASFVWGVIYGIGQSVIEDATYYRFYDAVIHYGGVAGLAFALAIVLLLRRPAPGVLAAGHAIATVSGLFGGSVGWQQGLWAYFGTFLVFIVCVAFRALCRFLSRREYAHNAASLRAGCANGGKARSRRKPDFTSLLRDGCGGRRGCCSRVP